MAIDNLYQQPARRQGGVTPEKIAYWFFRLNGCLTFENFVVHPDEAGSQRTDADVIAVRFPHRCELLTSGRPMEDHCLFTAVKEIPAAFFVEVKAGPCELNGPWTKPEKQNLQRVLYAMGFFPSAAVPDIANNLYRDRRVETPDMLLQFIAVGRERSTNRRLDTVPQLLWPEILGWIHGRFNDYQREKEDHRQWQEVGKMLYSSACGEFSEDQSGFVGHWLRQMGVAPNDASGTR